MEKFSDFNVIVDKELLDSFPEIKVDLVDTFQGKGFAVTTGNEGGCGSGCSGCD